MDNNSELLAALDTIAQRRPRVLVWGDVCRDVHYDVEERWNGEGAAQRWRATGAETSFGMSALVYLQVVALTERPVPWLVPGFEPATTLRAARVPVTKRRLWRDGINFLTLDECDVLPTAEELLKIRALLADNLREKPDAVAIVDYGHGACSADAVRYVIDAARAINCPVIVEPHQNRDWTRYEGASVIKCSREFYSAAQLMPGTLTVVTRGDGGVTLQQAGGRFQHWDATKRQGDATGCGDIVTAVLACAMGARLPLELGCELANVVAGLKLARRGAVPVSGDEVRRELAS